MMQKLLSKIQGESRAYQYGHDKIPKNLQSDPLSIQDVYRYRKQRGVNLGSWFVLERWITEEPFKQAKAPAQSDLDIAHGNNATEILERHWDTWIREDDWEWISSHGINSVRIPIGYYHLCGADPSVLEGTDFQPFHDVYAGAWNRITRALQLAAAHDIGVLIDLHAAPGKQNNDAHAGTSDKAHFFDDSHNQNCTIRVLCALIDNLNKFASSCDPPLRNIIGIELLNEPNPPSDKALQNWYLAAMAKIRSLDPTIPVYLGECWRTEAYADFISQHPSSVNALTVLDHHLYRCFTSSDIHTSAEDHARALLDPSAPIPRMLANASENAGRAGGGAIIGEWSGALNPRSLRGVPDEQRTFVAAQLNLFERVCAGWFFWTYKRQHMGDTGWSFRDAVERRVFQDFVGIKLHSVGQDDVSRRNAACNAMKDNALAAHKQYWSRYPGSHDHSFFEAGFHAGWDDAYQFMLSTPPTSKVVTQLGFTRAWARKRTSKDGKHYWEYETGFLQAVQSATLDYQNH